MPEHSNRLNYYEGPPVTVRELATVRLILVGWVVIAGTVMVVLSLAGG